MTQGLRVCAALAEDQKLLPSMHLGQLTIITQVPWASMLFSGVPGQ